MTPEQEAKFRERLAAEEAEAQDPRFAERLAAEEAELQEKLVNPMYGIAGGLGTAYGLGRLIKVYVEGKEKPSLGSGVRAPMEVPPEIAAKGPDAVENWAKTQHQGQYYGGSDYAAAHKKALDVKETVKETPGYRAMPGTGIVAPREAVEDFEAKKAAAERRKLPLSQRIIEKSPTAARLSSGASNVLRKGVPPFLGRTAAGGVGGYSAAEAYNRAVQGDTPGAVVSGAGALGGLMSLYPNPRTRALGILGMGASMLGNQLYDSPTTRPDMVPEAARSVMKGYAAGKKVVKGGLGLIGRDVPNVASSSIMQTVKDPRRMDFPGIYERPDLIAQRAVQNTAPESPLLKQLFGVTRDDLYEMSKRKGNVPGVIPGAAKKPKGSAAAEAVMTPRNEQRLLDIFYELQSGAPEMYRGMHGWYTMDPMYQHLVRLAGPDEAKRLYDRLNVYGGIESPNMPVPNEFRRASAAHMMAEQGRFPEWKKYGGLKAEERAGMPDYPADLMSVPGRVGHERAAASQEKYLLTGQHGMDSPKAPPYIQASSVPELGFQTDIPVGDAHWSRGVGLADVRTGKSTAESVSTPEIQQLAPWWREKIAGEIGTESVPAQGVLWGGLGPATGVKTAVGAPKLELKAIEIGNAARRLNISPEEARDLILLGKERAGKRAGGLV